jgi:site-specific DNA-methyltransferase (adenine-specific)
VNPYYQDDAVTIYHGDCREILPGIEADVLVTDPPYGIGFASQPTKWQRRAGHVSRDWDDSAVDGVVHMAATYTETCVWGGNYYALPPARGWLAWVKPDSPPSMGSVELAWTNLNRTAAHITHSISATNVERVGHPTQKPLRVMTWTLGFMGPGVIVDPFMGSGTTLRAAKDLGRKAIGIELEERYCEIAARRMCQEVLDFGEAA